MHYQKFTKKIIFESMMMLIFKNTPKVRIAALLDKRLNLLIDVEFDFFLVWNLDQILRSIVFNIPFVVQLFVHTS